MKHKVLFISVLWLSSIAQGKAQTDNLIDQLQTDERSAIEAIALYPQTERAAILEASAHPEILVRMQNIQRNTEEEFRNLLSPVSEEDQKKLFDLSRYPELIEGITFDGDGKSNTQMDALLTDYPDDIKEEAKDMNKNRFDVLVKMNNLTHSSDDAFKAIVDDYPAETQQAYQTLLQLPEVVNILSENMDMTVLLGDIYQKNPDQLQHELDSFGVVLAEQKAQELNEWKETLESDSEAMAQYEQASKEFAEEQGYDESEYTSSRPDRYRTDVYVHHVWRPYSYWFGWPWWYTYECWYPYPWWYHWGYYYGPGNVVVFVGLPSNVFVQWHFYNHRHFYYYPRFTNHVIRHYHHHPRSHTSVTRVVKTWERETSPELPKNWLNDDVQRADRIQEYGKFKMEYDETVRKAETKAPTQREYLKENSDKYPSLKPVLKENPAPADKAPKVEKRQEPAKEQYQPPKYQPKEKVIEKKESDYQRIDKAKNHHQNTWDKNKPLPKVTTPTRKSVPTQKQNVPSQRQNVPTQKSKTPVPTQKQTQPKQQPFGK